MQDMGELLRQAQVMRDKMAEIQEGLAAKTVEGSSGGGMVRVVCNGKQEIMSVAIDKTVVDAEDTEMLQDLVAVAVNHALGLSREMARQELSALTGGFTLPGLM